MPLATDSLTLAGPDGRELTFVMYADGTARVQVKTKTKSIAFLLDRGQQEQVENFFGSYSE